jgi:orotate phosphoribosyltransferase-like protein
MRVHMKTTNVKGGNAMSKTMTPNALATELNVSPKTLRAYLRRVHTRDVNAKNTSWAIDVKTCNAARKHFANRANA